MVIHFLDTHTQMDRWRPHLVEKSFWELLETLSTDKTLLVVKFPVAVHYLLCRSEGPLAAFTHGVRQGIRHVTGRERREQRDEERGEVKN